MIVTVIVSNNTERDQWQAELLEHTWQQSGQSGELVRLVADYPGSALPVHSLARVVAVPSWSMHPYIDDMYSGYELPAGLLWWLMEEQMDATILLLERDSILQQPFQEEVLPGQGMADRWMDFPGGDGPFELSSDYINLQAYCVNRDLPLSQVQLPVLMHSQDLLKIAPRWLELTGIIRHDVRVGEEPPVNAVKTAFAIAAAEYHVPVKAYELASSTLDQEAGRQVLSYAPELTTVEGRLVFDARIYRPGDTLQSEKAQSGREFLEYLESYAASVASGEVLHYLRPRRRPGVRQGRILDQFYLETGRPPRMITLNSSAGAIWDLCDGQRSLLDVARELHARYAVPMETMAADVLQTAKMLRSEGALNLEPANL
jgi:hypothetical protein